MTIKVLILWIDRFWKKVRKKGLEIRYVATDLSAAFISSVSENCLEAILMFDYFHVMKLMNDKLNETRRVQYNMEKNVNKRKVLKGTRYYCRITPNSGRTR